MTTNEFIEKMVKDETVANKMEACKCPEEAYEAAKEAGLTDDIDTFKTIMTAINKQIKGELSEEELENISGGSTAGAVYNGIITGICGGIVLTVFSTAA
ncbi:MAG: Nif11-like leader peptide family RiPP precursor [Oscillospiraceae bacterium]